MHDWYRQTSWNGAIEEYFFKKLARARKDSRAQYLKIQAIELIETRDTALLHAAEMLLQKLLSDYPDNKIDRSQSLNSLGDICRLRESFTLSLDYYKKALDFEEIFPNVITHAYLNFSEIVIKLKKQEFYSLAERSILKRGGPNSPFPIERYKSCSFLSVINFRKGDHGRAIEFATLAEQSVSATNSDLRNHKTLGIVTKQEKWVDDLIAHYKTEIASGRDVR